MATSLSEAAQMLNSTLLTPDERKRRQKALDRIRTEETGRIRKRHDDTLEQAKSAYELACEAQDELYRAWKDLARREGRMTAADYRARYEELTATQQQVERDRAQARATLVRVGEQFDALEDDPDGVVDDFYRRHSALPHPARQLGW